MNFAFNHYFIKLEKHTKCSGHNSCTGADTFRLSYILTDWERPPTQNSLLLRGLQWTLYNCTWEEPSFTTSNLCNQIIFVYYKKVCIVKTIWKAYFVGFSSLISMDRTFASSPTDTITCGVSGWSASLWVGALCVASFRETPRLISNKRTCPSRAHVAIKFSTSNGNHLVWKLIIILIIKLIINLQYCKIKKFYLFKIY